MTEIAWFLALLMGLRSHQWCSGKTSLVGTLAWHDYGHISYRYRGGGGGGLNELSRVKIHVQTGDNFEIMGRKL